MNLLLLGPQGAGKGTQAARIAAEYDVPHVATGDMLRAAVAAKTPLGLEVKPILDSGRLVPDATMTALIAERLGEPDAAHGFVLDGFPRTLAQAEALEPILASIGKELSLVLELLLDDDECIRRMLLRAELEGRSDDTPEVIRERLRTYHEKTAPLVEWYRGKGVLATIPGDGTIDAVFEEIQHALDRSGLVPA